jgi:hypothetical protein
MEYHILHKHGHSWVYNLDIQESKPKGHGLLKWLVYEVRTMIAQPGAVEVYMAVPEREPRGYSWAGVISKPHTQRQKGIIPRVK